MCPDATPLTVGEASEPRVASSVPSADLGSLIGADVRRSRFPREELARAVAYGRAVFAVREQLAADDRVAVYVNQMGFTRYLAVGASHGLPIAPAYLAPTVAHRARSAWRCVVVFPVRPPRTSESADA